jgi:hypothetical protein
VSEQLQIEVAEARATAARIRQRAFTLPVAPWAPPTNSSSRCASPTSSAHRRRASGRWCEQEAAKAIAKWEASGDKLLAERSPWYNGFAVSFTVQWKDGVLTGGSAKVELLPGKTVQVQSMQEVIGGAAYGT